MANQNRLEKLLVDLKARVRKAIKKGLISKNDIKLNNEKRLLSFIKFSLVEIVDRKTALDILRTLDYDANTPWEDLQSKYGTFETIEDIAVVDILRNLAAIGADKFAYYVDVPNEEIKYPES